MPTTSTAITQQSQAPEPSSMPEILATLRVLSDQGAKLVQQGAALQSTQDEMRREIAKVRETGEATERRVLIMETRQEEREKAQKEVAALKADAKADAKDSRTGVQTWVMWVGAAMITLLAALLSAIATTWVTAAHK